MKIVLIFALLSLSACYKKEGCINLSDYNQLWIVSSKEQFIANEHGSYILGPSIYSLDVVKGYTIGMNTNMTYGNYKNIPGYFIFEPGGIYKAGLTLEGFEKLLFSYGIDEYDLSKGPSSQLNPDNLFSCKSMGSESEQSPRNK